MAVQLKQSYHHLPLTITPILHPTSHILQQQTLPNPLQPAPNPPQPQPPDLTFHCMCCAEFFVHPLALYQHMNTLHPNEHPSEQQEPENPGEESEDYSWIFEPVCELAEDGSASSEGSDSSGSDSSSSSDDDDDDSSSSSSSSNSSSSSSSVPTSSNSNTQQSQETLQPMRGLVAGPGYNEFQLQMADPRESTSIFMLQPPAVSFAPLTQLAPPVPTPLLGLSLDSAPIKRRRGRRSNFNVPPMDPALSGTQKCFQCTHCEASFPNAGDLSKHVRSHITNKPFQCSICQKTFTHIGSLNTHIRIHSGEKPYKCELCPKAFTQSSSLMVHMRSHSVRKPHQCLECDKGFINYSSLLLHQKTHSAPTETFVCPECEREFKAEALLDEHMRMHTQELVYQCAICREAFRASSELVQHMKNHMGEKPFTCSLCDRSFTQSGSLNIHMRIHTGEKPFQCKLCDKCFTQASSLSVHMKIHAGEKPYPCPICGKSYSQQAYLNKHIQAHQVAAAAASASSSPGLLVTKQPHETLVCIVCGSLHADATALASHVTSKHAALLDTMKQSAMNTPPGGAHPEGKCTLEEQQAYMQRVQTVLQQMNQQQQQQQMPLPQQPKLSAMDSTGEDEEEPDEAEDPPDEEDEEDELGETPEEEAEVHEAEEALINQGYPMLGLQEEQILLDSDMYYDDFADMDVGCQEEVFGDFAVNEEEVCTDALM
ncbi:hypothetical protein KR084_002439 [Drosophila pseudotakahashii]|nr:hypothetical protein KR084_002439 [Drosophila pseudotakahashii]